MNPSLTSQIHSMHCGALSKRSSKKVSIMDTVGPKADLATTLFLGDLSILCDEVKLYGLFCRFGVIESVQLKKSDRDPQRAHLGFGFIKFAIRDCAAKAIQEMNGYFFLGRAMRVGWALDYGKKGYQWLMETVSDPKKNQTAQIHVMFVTRELNRRVSELDIGAVFGRYGNLVDVAIKKNAINHEYGVQSGYAFLHFALTHEGLRSAVTAVERGNLLVVDNITYRCKVTHSMQTQLISMKKEEEKLLGKRDLPPSLTHAVLSPLDDSTFKTYYGSAPNASSKHFVPSVMNEYHDANFPSYNINPTKTMSRSEQDSKVLPPLPSHVSLLLSLHDFSFESESGFSDDCTFTSGHTGLSANSTANTASMFQSNHHHLPARLLTSSFIHPTYEDPFTNSNTIDSLDDDYYNFK